MIAELARCLPDFPGPANQTRCFAHIINLVARSLLRQFETTPKKTNDASDGLEGLDLDAGEEELTRSGPDVEAGFDDDNIEGWIDEVALLGEEERDELKAAVQPVQVVLVKVSSV